MRRPRPRTLVFAAAALVVVAAVVWAWGPVSAALTLERVDVDTERARERIEAASPPTTQVDLWGTATTTFPIDPDALSEDLVVVLVGSDGRPPYAGERADVIIVVEAPEDPTKPITLISIPRDTYAEIPCLPPQRINAALGGCSKADVDGLTLIALTVEDFTGLEVDHVAAVDFGGFARAVDILGGYPLCVEHAVRDRKSHLELEEGCHTLSGDEALAWVRSRNTYELVGGEWRHAGTSDFTRTDRQRELLSYFFKKATSGGIGELADVVRAAGEVVVLDSDWSLTSIVSAGWELRSRPIVEGRILTSGYRDSYGRAMQRPEETYAEAKARILDEAGLGDAATPVE